ncbi:hypothetical protein [Halomontanus rarus]|uniref:hypothetical protein n=1 Tax=Halomontanus rarus TaxID=3034020 RepID=UPI0023E75645|nr:hypothetical protein [Halovivax sp. TS33]
MNERSLVAGSLLLAIVLAGIVTVLTESLAVLATTPTGFAIYLGVGVGLPQYVLSRRTDSPLRLGLAVFAIVGALLVLLGGLAFGDPHGEWGSGITGLFIVVVGVLLGAIWRSFVGGYRSGADSPSGSEFESESASEAEAELESKSLE